MAKILSKTKTVSTSNDNKKEHSFGVFFFVIINND